MPQLPRGLKEAAESSIASYEKQIEMLQTVGDAASHHAAKRALTVIFDADEDLIVEALEHVIGLREESIKVLKEGLASDD